MANLLPEKEKDALYRENRYKLYIVAGLGLLECIAIFCVVLLPSYFLSRSKLEAANNQLRVLKESTKYRDNQDIESELKTTQDYLKSVFPLVSGGQIEKHIQAAVVKKPRGILVTSLSYFAVDEKVATINLSGFAKKRSDLISYETNLKKDGYFLSVDLPISNLAKDNDIEFSMSLSIDLEKQ